MKAAEATAAAATVSAKAPAAVAAPTPAATTNSDGEEIYIAPVAVKGMEADKVDLSALKSLRVSSQFYVCTLLSSNTFFETTPLQMFRCIYLVQSVKKKI